MEFVYWLLNFIWFSILFTILFIGIKRIEK